MPVPHFHKKNLDKVIYLDGPEWKTSECVKDVLFLGNKSLLLYMDDQTISFSKYRKSPMKLVKYK